MAQNNSAAKSAEKGARPPGPTDRNSRTSRDQGKRENAADSRQRETSLAATRPMNLPYIEPRTGYVQRWVRVRLKGQDDADNVARKESEGWQRRAIETVPKGVSVPKIKSGDHEGYIGVQGNILMERPVEIHAQVSERNKSNRQRQMRAIEEQLHADHKPGQGIGKPRMKVQTAVGVKRRQVEVQEDEDN